MFRRRFSEQVPELNTTSTADISFMLLIFFLVTSSMDTEKGLLRQMPPPQEENVKPQDVAQEHVISLQLSANDSLSLNGTLMMSQQQTAEELSRMISNDPKEHVVQLEVDREASYEAYYRMQNMIAVVYRKMGLQQRVAEEMKN